MPLYTQADQAQDLKTVNGRNFIMALALFGRNMIMVYAHDPLNAIHAVINQTKMKFRHRDLRRHL
jgi:hypothetical protein